MPHSLLNVGDHLPGIGLIPAPVQVLGRNTKLDHQVTREVLRLDLAALLAPEPNQRPLVTPHDNSCIRAADEGAPITA
jgi:hypothetical protein